MSQRSIQPDKGRGKKLYWQYEDSFGGCWSAIYLDKYENEHEVCKVEVETMGPEEGKFVVWVKRRGMDGMTRALRGPLKGPFDCLCSAVKACEAYYG